MVGSVPLFSLYFQVYLFSNLKFISYHLGNTKMGYLPKENMAVKNS